MPEGSWFWVEVHQMLGTSGALSEVYMDGALVGRSTAANTAGRTIERIRYGLVAQGNSSKTKAWSCSSIGARVRARPARPDRRRDAGAASHPDPEPLAVAEPDPGAKPDPAPNAAPTVALTSPVAGARFTRSLALAANASDDLGVERIEFRIDGKAVATDSKRPYAVSVNTRNLADGAHTVTATAYDAEGLKASDSVSVTKGAALATATKAEAQRTSAARRARCATHTVRRLHGARAAKRARTCRRLAAKRPPPGPARSPRRQAGGDPRPRLNPPIPAASRHRARSPEPIDAPKWSTTRMRDQSTLTRPTAQSDPRMIGGSSLSGPGPSGPPRAERLTATL